MKHILLTALLILIAATSAAAQNLFNSSITQLSNYKNFRTVAGNINQQPIKFVFDTGANRTVLSPRIAKKLKLNLTGSETINTARGEVKAKSGSIEIDVDGHKAAVNVLVSDFATLHGVEAILGTDFLEQFNFLFDSAANTIIFNSPMPSEAPTTNGLANDGRFQIVVKINGVSKLFLIDTGAAELTVFEKQGATLVNANFNNFQNDVSKQVKIEIAQTKQTLNAVFLPPSGAQTSGLIPAKLFRKLYFDKTKNRFYLYM